VVTGARGAVVVATVLHRESAVAVVDGELGEVGRDLLPEGVDMAGDEQGDVAEDALGSRESADLGESRGVADDRGADGVSLVLVGVELCRVRPTWATSPPPTSTAGAAGSRPSRALLGLVHGGEPPERR
jgi:hypothetical protein